jgi:hypothetical protein
MLSTRAVQAVCQCVHDLGPFAQMHGTSVMPAPAAAAVCLLLATIGAQPAGPPCLPQQGVCQATVDAAAVLCTHTYETSAIQTPCV